MAARRSNRQLSVCFTMSSSRAATSFAAPSNRRFANSRVLSEALAPRQNLTSSLVGSCWLISHWKSICMANSRDLLRTDTLSAPRLSGRGRFERRHAQFPGEVRHFNGCKAGLKTLVAAFEAGAVNGLLERVAGQH